MATYARPVNGVVAELFSPPAGLTIAQCFNSGVQWIECDGTPGVAVGWTATLSGTTWTFAAPPPPAPTLSQQVDAAIAAGMQVASTGTPALNGTYPCDPASQQKIMGVSLFIQINGKFPGNATTYPWIDVAGAAHTFPSTAEFQAFATAFANYVAALDMIAATNSGTLPTQPVTIA